MTSENESARRETVADIVREMRHQATIWTERHVPCFFELSDHWNIVADRIEEAHAREVEARAIIAGASLADGECQRLRDENARMRKAIVNAMRVVEILKGEAK